MLSEQEGVCVLLINYFSAEKTIRCLNSIINEPIETIYVLDNSVDELQRNILIKYIEEKESLKYCPAIIFLSYKENLGFSKGINKILEYDYATNNKHTHFCLLNNDTVPHQGFITPLKSELDNTEYALVSPKILWGADLVKYRYYSLMFGANSLREFPFSFPYLTGCCLMFRDDWLQKRKLFDEDFFMYGEDIELCWRVSKQKKRIKVVAESVIYHEASSSSINGSLFYEYYLAFSHLLLINKTQNSKHMILLSCFGKAVFLLVRACARTFRNKSIIPLKAYFMGWLNFIIKSRPVPIPGKSGGSTQK